MTEEGYQPIKTKKTTKIIPPNTGSHVRKEKKYGDSYGEKFRQYEERIAELEEENAELKKRLRDIELLCYSDGSDGEVLAEIMTYFTKE